MRIRGDDRRETKKISGSMGRESWIRLRYFPAETKIIAFLADFNLVVPRQPSHGQVKDVAGFMELFSALLDRLRAVRVQDMADPSRGIDKLTTNIHHKIKRPSSAGPASDPSKASPQSQPPQNRSAEEEKNSIPAPVESCASIPKGTASARPVAGSSSSSAPAGQES